MTKCLIGGCQSKVKALGLCPRHYERNRRHGSPHHFRPSPKERFEANIVKLDCWHWLGDANYKGYGRLSVNGRKVLAHRFAWEMQHGPIPKGKCIMHHCDNPSCVNPKHLFIGTQADNVADMMAKGRHASQKEQCRQQNASP